MNLIKKLIILSFVPGLCLNNYLDISNKIKICNAEEINSNISFNAVCDSQINFEEEKFNIKIYALSKQNIQLENLEVEVIFDNRIFKFIKKYFDFSDIFKTKIENINENNKILKFSMKNKESVDLKENINNKIFDFELDIKKKLPSYETDIKILIKSENNNHVEDKHIKIFDKNQIENIIINTKTENSEFKFDKNINKYNLSVSGEEKYIIFEIETIDKNKKIIKKKLKKAGSVTNIRINNYEFEVFRNEKKKSDKKTKKTKKIKKNKNREKIKNQKENSREKIDQKNNCEYLEDYEQEQDDSYSETKQEREQEQTNQKDNKYFKTTSEETITNPDESKHKIILNIIKILAIIILILILTQVFYKKFKNFKNRKS